MGLIIVSTLYGCCEGSFGMSDIDLAYISWSMLAIVISSFSEYLVRSSVTNFVVKLISLPLPSTRLPPPLPVFTHPSTVQVVLIANLAPFSLSPQPLKTRVFFLNWLFPSPLPGGPPSFTQQAQPWVNCLLVPNPHASLTFGHSLPFSVSILQPHWTGLDCSGKYQRLPSSWPL